MKSMCIVVFLSSSTLIWPAVPSKLVENELPRIGWDEPIQGVKRLGLTEPIHGVKRFGLTEPIEGVKRLSLTEHVDDDDEVASDPFNLSEINGIANMMKQEFLEELADTKSRLKTQVTSMIHKYLSDYTHGLLGKHEPQSMKHRHEKHYSKKNSDSDEQQSMFNMFNFLKKHGKDEEHKGHHHRH